MSVEQFPIAPEELAQAHALWPELAGLSAALRQHYPATLQGMHYREIDFSDSYPNSLPIKLSLIFTEAQTGFAQLLTTTHTSETALASEAVDAWFLDGFSPSKNPDMWQDSLFNLMARLSFNQGSHTHTTLATFTAAGFVKRGLKQAGFNIRKHKGFGRKRDMLVGSFQGRPLLCSQLKSTARKLGFGDFWPLYRPLHTLHSKQQSVAIIGAGISGLTTAYTLAKAGFQVSVYEANSDAMQEASGNPQAVLFPKLSPHKTALSEFNLLSLNFSVNHYQQLNQQSDIFSQCGLLQCAAKESPAQLAELAASLPQLMRYLNAEQASAISNTTIQHSALYYPNLGFINTQQLKTLLLAQQGLQFYPNYKVTGIHNAPSPEPAWQLVFEKQRSINADFVVICNAHAARSLLPRNSIQLKNIRGQITQVSQADNHSAALPDLQTTVCHRGYINPAMQQASGTQYSFGASFDLGNHSATPDEKSDAYNIKQLTQYLSDFSFLNESNQSKDPSTLQWQAKVNFRCTSTDYMPVVGPVINEESAGESFELYGKNARAHIPHRINCHEGLLLNIGYGSRGFSTAPISAEVIKSYLTAGIQPLPKAIVKALHPGRFYIKQRKQPKPPK